MNRRESDQSLIKRLAGKVNVMIGYSFLATVIIIGGYAYTKDVKHDLNIKYRDTDTKIGTLVDQVSELKIIVERNEAKQNTVIKYMELEVYGGRKK